jgi:uncharacterized SAM-binding protein YcdF (DUF218 family)
MKRFDAIFALGISTNPKLFRPRVRKAVMLRERGFGKAVIFSGRFWGGLRRKPFRTEASRMARYAIDLGLPRTDIFLEERSLNTIGNFYFTKKNILEPNGFRNVLILTHQAHVPKARFLAAKILGPKYHVSFQTDGLKIPFMHSGSSDSRRYFASVESGNDQQVAALLRRHRYYARYRKF